MGLSFFGLLSTSEEGGGVMLLLLKAPRRMRVPRDYLLVKLSDIQPSTTPSARVTRASPHPPC